MSAVLWGVHPPDRLADEENDYFRGHPLFQTDARALDARFVEPGPLVDLGCGTGRHALRFARRGFPVVAVDLSHAMLRTASGAERTRRNASPFLGVEANLCRLGVFRGGNLCLRALDVQHARHDPRTARATQGSGRERIESSDAAAGLRAPSRTTSGSIWATPKAGCGSSTRPGGGRCCKNQAWEIVG